MYDGHAGSGAAIAASKLLHRLIRDRLGEVAHLLENPASPPPICLAKNGSPYQATESKKGAAAAAAAAAAAQQQGEGAAAEEPDAISDPTIRYHMEKVVSMESLVMGVLENAFRQMVSKSRRTYVPSQPHSLTLTLCGWKQPCSHCGPCRLPANMTEQGLLLLWYPQYLLFEVLNILGAFYVQPV